MARCAQPGCWDRDQTNVCWYPRQTTVATQIGKNAAGGNVIVDVPAGANICVQSTRNPTCLSNPGMRPTSAQGYRWVYWNAGSGTYTGWMPNAHISAHAGVAGCLGPADADYVCGTTPKGCYDTVGCSDRNDPGTTLRRDGYIRYAPTSTAYHWVGQNANVQRKGFNSANGDYACVVVVSNGKYCPDGTVGWIEQDALN